MEIRPLACQERGCKMTIFEDYPSADPCYQHGENPEAVRTVSRIERGYVRAATWQRFYTDIDGRVPPACVEDWAERVHEYEEADTAAPAAAPGGRDDE